MSSPIHVVVRRLLAETRSSFRRARRGSILILVVALLVLVAIIGAAALSTNTIDRYATGQNTANTQIDLLVEGVKNMAKSVLVGDLQGLDPTTGQILYRPEGSGTYDHWDMPLMIDLNKRPPGMRKELFAQMKQSNDAWLSPRYPDLQNPHPNVANPANGGTFDPNNFATNPPIWDCIGASLDNPNGVPTAGQFLFDSPGVFNPSTGSLNTTAARGYNYRITDRTPAQEAPPRPMTNALIPTSLTYTLAGGQQAVVPGWVFDGNFYIGADADGDGITDAGMKRINVGEINGLTYYYGVRIIDNGSQINVNTAHVRDHEFLGDSGDGQGTQAMSSRASVPVPQLTNFFPSSIGLAELLRTSNSGTATSITQLRTSGGTLNEIGRIDAYRFNNVLLPSGIITDQVSGVATPNNNVYVDDPNTGSITPHTDFAYNTIGEALYYGLTRRLGNPGYLTDTNVRFNPFSSSESAALAYHFVMVNPDASRSALENATALATNPNSQIPPNAASPLIDSLFWSAGNRMPDPSPAQPRSDFMRRSSYNGGTLAGLGYWFADNFAWDNEFVAGGPFPVEDPTKYTNRRSMFTASNPVSNQIPLPLGIGSLAAARKAAVNTASVDELYSAFYSVMSEGGQASPYRATTATTPLPTPTPTEFYYYTGMRFTQSTPTYMGTGTIGPTNGSDLQPPASFMPQQGQDTHLDRMFRAPIRENANLGDKTAKYDEVQNKVIPPTDTSASTHMLPQHVRILRAYLAAMNTASMRNPFRNYYPQVLKAISNPTNPLIVQVGNTQTPVDLIAYGAEPQPFITEVYVNTDTNRNASDYNTADPNATGLGKNDEPYVAIELFYPYAIPTQDPTLTTGTGEPWDMRPVLGAPNGGLAGWTIELVDRASARTNGKITTTAIGTITASNAFFTQPTATDPRLGTYIILENFDENAPNYGTAKVRYRPRSSGLPYRAKLETWHNASSTPMPPIKSVYVPGLAQAIKRGTLPTDPGGELVICRHLPSLGAGQPVLPPRPLDSFDFTGIENQSTLTGAGPNTPSNIAYTVHYARAGRTLANTGEWWSFIYPGRYNGGENQDPIAGVFLGRRHQGMQVGRWNNTPVADPNDAASPDYPRADGNYDPFDRSIRTGIQVLDPPVTLGGDFSVLTNDMDPQDNASDKASYPITFRTQLLNEDQPGWNPIGGYTAILGSVPPNKFPYGAFARNSDIMQIPYFGAYRIVAATPVGQISPETYEVNPMTIDSAFCEDTDIYDDDDDQNPQWSPAFFNTWEQLGRFAPVTMTIANPLVAGAYPIDDLDPQPDQVYKYFTPDLPDPDPNTGLRKNAWRYHWTTRLFDYLTVQNPETDFFPNVEPNDYLGKMGGNRPVPVSNEGGTAGDPTSGVPGAATAENGVPVHGLINLNTASWRVLSAINWTPFAAGTADRDRFHLQPRVDGEYEMVIGPNQVDDNIELAKAIAWWRDGKDDPTTIPIFGTAPDDSGGPIGPKGPFRSLYDLYRVWALRTYYTWLSSSFSGLPEPDDADGDYSPFNLNPRVTAGGSAYDEVRSDFEERYQLLARVSNLVTTRSDSFTVYIVVQGWRNVNSTDPNNPPELVVQRRAAFIADRSGVTATGGSLKITNVATE